MYTQDFDPVGEELWSSSLFGALPLLTLLILLGVVRMTAQCAALSSLVLAMCVLVYVQSTDTLGWMVVE